MAQFTKPLTTKEAAAFANALECISRRFDLWIDTKQLSGLPLLHHSEGNEAGYTVHPGDSNTTLKLELRREGPTADEALSLDDGNPEMMPPLSDALLMGRH